MKCNIVYTLNYRKKSSENEQMLCVWDDSLNKFYLKYNDLVSSARKLFIFDFFFLLNETQEKIILQMWCKNKNIIIFLFMYK